MKLTDTQILTNPKCRILEFKGEKQQNLKHKPSSILEGIIDVDDIQEGDFTQTLIISTLSNWSNQHLKAMLNDSINCSCLAN
jgi:hypothetical protein